MTTSSIPKILFVLTSHGKLGSTEKPTGWYLPELAHPYSILKPHASITVASPAGGEAPLDPSSVEMYKEDKISQDFLKTDGGVYKNSQVLSTFIGRASEFDAIFFVGGHGPMFDLANNPTSEALVAEFHAAGKIIAAVCHGSAALLNVKLANGEYLLKGQPVTGFSDEEEDTIQLSSFLPYKLETELNKRSGGMYKKAEAQWGEKVVIGNGGKLITGQNPASAGPLAEAIKKALNLQV